MFDLEIDSDKLIKLLSGKSFGGARKYLKELGRLQIVDWRDAIADVLEEVRDIIKDDQFVPLFDKNGKYLEIEFMDNSRTFKLNSSDGIMTRFIPFLRNAVARKYILRILNECVGSDTYYLVWLTYKNLRSLEKRDPRLIKNRLIDPISIEVLM